MSYSNEQYVDRPPVVSGRFYSSGCTKLEKEIIEMLDEAKLFADKPSENNNNLLALVAPHAGYMFSGVVAASAFLQLKNIKPRRRVFLIGSSHHTSFNGASIYCKGDYLTPLGKVNVDKELASQLIQDSEVFRFVEDAHANEHCIEVLLPFLQFLWQDKFEIIPIIIASQTKDMSKKIAQVLKPWYTTDNLFIVSTDLSHYPSYEDAVSVDNRTIEATLTGDPEILLRQLKLNKEAKTPNLSTSMCGWTSVLTLLYLNKSEPKNKLETLLYKNSGDVKILGETDRVVGYQSMAAYFGGSNSDFEFSNHEESIILTIVRNSVIDYIRTGKRLKPDTDNSSKKLQLSFGAFVSIYHHDKLLGCVGQIQPHNTPLAELIADIAISAAFYDTRFPNVSSKIVDEIKIEVSILSSLTKMNSINELILGKHGILIRKGSYSGTFLPQVAVNSGWSKEEFIGHCSRDKAGLQWDGWKDADVFLYEAFIIKEE